MTEAAITDDDEITLITYNDLAVLMEVSKGTAIDLVQGGSIPLVRISERAHRVTLANAKRYIQGLDMAPLEISDVDEITMLRYDEFASILGVSLRIAMKTIEESRIPVVKISKRLHRITIANLKRYINAGGARAHV